MKCSSFELVANIFISHQKNGNNTYVTPNSNFDGFIKGELCFVRESDNTKCVIFRPWDGNLYNLSISQLNKFELTGLARR